jgi:hypothetical protein
MNYRTLLAIVAVSAVGGCAPEADDGRSIESTRAPLTLSGAEELIAWYRFEPGALLTDSSGNGHHLFSGNPASWSPAGSTPAPDAAGAQAARFDGTDDIVRTAAPLPLSTYRKLHVDWWLRPRNDPGATGIVFEHSGDFNTAPGGFLAAVQNAPSGGTTGAAGMRLDSNFNLDAFDDGPANVWQHLDLFLDASAGRAEDVLRLSKNGALTASLPYLTHQGTGLVNLRDDWFVIGARGGSLPFPYHLKGDLDELRLSRDARLLAWWRFEPGASFLSDSSGSGHDLLVSGGGQPASLTTNLAAGRTGNGAARFQATNRLVSRDRIDLSPYRRVRVSAWIRENKTSDNTRVRAVAWELGNTFVNRPGSVSLTFNDDTPGAGLAGYWTDPAGPSLDRFYHDTNWHYVVVDFDRAAPAQSAVRMHVDGAGEREISTEDRYAQGGGFFLDDVFFVGGRGETSAFNFQGDIDELKIEAILDARTPTPAPTKLYVLAGQSNALGEAFTPTNDAAFRSPQWGSWIWNQGDWSPVQPGLGWLDDRFGPEVSFASRMFECTHERVALVKYAVGDTTLFSDWTAGSGVQYQGLLRAIVAARASFPTAELAGVLWMQGESDALRGQGSSYQANLERFIAQLRSDVRVPLRVAIGRIRSEWGGDASLVRAAQATVAATSPNATLISTDDLSIYTSGEDVRHFDDAGMRGLGKRFAEGLLGVSSCSP